MSSWASSSQPFSLCTQQLDQTIQDSASECLFFTAAKVRCTQRCCAKGSTKALKNKLFNLLGTLVCRMKDQCDSWRYLSHGMYFHVALSLITLEAIPLPLLLLPDRKVKSTPNLGTKLVMRRTCALLRPRPSGFLATIYIYILCSLLSFHWPTSPQTRHVTKPQLQSNEVC